MQGGANIDLTTADMTAIFAFFGKGAFRYHRTHEQGSRIRCDVGFSEIWANLAQPYVVNGVVSGTVLQAVLLFAPVKEIPA